MSEQGERLVVWVCPACGWQRGEGWHEWRRICESVQMERIEVVPASRVTELEAALTEFLAWFDSRFPTGGGNLPGVTLHSIAEKARSALSPSERSSE